MTIDDELNAAQGWPAFAVPDLLMMQMMGEFDKILRHFRDTNDYEQIKREIALTKEKATFSHMYERIINMVSKQQFGDSAAALRELSQNAIDAYDLKDTDRKVHFTIGRAGDYVVLRARDYGGAMTLAEIVELLLIPYNTTKIHDPRKIGEHGIGWYSVIDISRLVKVESKKTGSDRVAQVIIRDRDHTLEALVHEEDGELAATTPVGTTVTLYIPQDLRNFDETSIRKHLCKYVGYVDAREAEILLDNQPINNLSEEYLTGLTADITINRQTEPLTISFSKRAIAGNFADDRFDERNQNLKHIVYTQAGLWIKYGSNPFDSGTIQGQLYEDLTKMGLDFWIQLPRNVGLTMGRNDMISEHANDVLEATYNAFRSLFLESIITDDQILYHPSKILEEGVSRLLRSEYLDHVRAQMISQYPRKRRIMASILPPLQKTAETCYKVGRFVVTLPFKIVYYSLLIPYSLSASAVRAVGQMNVRSIATGVMTTALIGAMAFGGYTLYETHAKESQHAAAQESQQAVASTNTLQDIQQQGGEHPSTDQQAADKQQATPARPPSPPKDIATSETARATPQSAPSTPKYQPLATPTTEPSATTPSANSTPAPHEDTTPERSIIATLTETLTRARDALQPGETQIVAEYERAREYYHKAEESLEHHLEFLGDNKEDTAKILLGIGSIIGLLSAGYYLSRGLKASHLRLSTIFRIAGKVALAPLYPVFLAGRALRSVVGEASEAYQRRIGLYTNIDEKKQQAIAARREEIIQKYRSKFETTDFMRTLLGKKILHATLIDAFPRGNRRVWNMDVAQIPGTKVRVSIYEVITLFTHDRVHCATYRDETVHLGDYFVDEQQPLVKNVMAMLHPLRKEIREKFDPVVLEDRLDALKAVGMGTLKFAYLVSGLGLLHLLMSAVYTSIPNPYKDSVVYQGIARVARKVPRVLTPIAKLPVYCAMGVGIGAFYLGKALLYHAPIYGYNAACSGAKRLGKLPDAYDDLKKYFAQRRETRAQHEQEKAKQREATRQEKQLRALAKEHEKQQRAAEKENARRSRAAEKEAARQRKKQKLLERCRLKAEADRIHAEEQQCKAAEKAAERAADERQRNESRQRARETTEQLRRQRQQRWMDRGGLSGIIGSKLSSAAVTVSSGAKAFSIGLRDTVYNLGKGVATAGSGALYGLEYGVSSIGKGIIYLTTKDPGEVLLSGCTIDAERLHRVVEYTRIGQNYQLLLQAAQQVDALLSDSAQLPRLRLSYSYKVDSSDDVIGHLGGSQKKPELALEMESDQVQKLIKGLDGTKSMTYYTLLESLLHHKAHQQQGGAHHVKTFYEAKERLRAQFFDYAHLKHIRFEDALDNDINAHRRRGQLQDFVDGKEIARLSQMRILGLLKERGRIQRVYGR